MKSSVAIVDLELGNIASVVNCVRFLEANPKLPRTLVKSDVPIKLFCQALGRSAMEWRD